jgi:hypothetical protein
MERMPARQHVTWRVELYAQLRQMEFSKKIMQSPVKWRRRSSPSLGSPLFFWELDEQQNLLFILVLTASRSRQNNNRK